MKNVSKRTALLLAASVALVACSGGGLGAPAGGTGQTSLAARSGDADATRNYSGQYAGIVHDSLNGKGGITASFAQYQTAIGGSMTQSEGSRSSTMSVSFAVTNATTFTGSAASEIGSAVCVYTIGGRYNTATHRLKGSYQAVSGCSGETGTFTMKQKCYYARQGMQHDVGGLRMC